MNKEERKFKEKLPSDKVKSLGFAVARMLLIPPIFILVMNVLHFYGHVEYDLEMWGVMSIIYIIVHAFEFYGKLIVLQEELQIKEGKES